MPLPPKLTPLRDVIVFMRNGTTAAQNSDGSGFPVTRIETISDGSIDIGRVRFVEIEEDSLEKWKLVTGDILLSHINSVAHIGKSALYQGTPPVLIHGMNLLLIRPDLSKIVPDYLHFALNSRPVRQEIRARCKRAINQASINQKELGAIDIPVPDLFEQHRIVDILKRADGLRRLRAHAHDTAHQLIPSLFIEMFDDPAANPNGWTIKPLKEVADIGSGVTKGRKLGAHQTVELPYLAVSNVQDGHLNLTKVKSIQVKPAEIEKYQVLPGDFLMTEGGDPDKLGRGAIWNGEIDVCLHQNHIFKVRCNRDMLLPEYLRSLVGSHYGKGYFLRVAKQTTGIASINKTQLGNFPVLVPPIEKQNKFVTLLESIDSIITQQNAAQSGAESSFQSLLHRAFNGVI